MHLVICKLGVASAWNIEILEWCPLSKFNVHWHLFPVGARFLPSYFVSSYVQIQHFVVVMGRVAVHDSYPEVHCFTQWFIRVLAFLCLVNMGLPVSLSFVTRHHEWRISFRIWYTPWDRFQLIDTWHTWTTVWFIKYMRPDRASWRDSQWWFMSYLRNCRRSNKGQWTPVAPRLGCGG